MFVTAPSLQKSVTGTLCTGVIIACIAILNPVIALAGDFAKREILGFSQDGGLFAFEEFGVQDGSGFPYSNIYVIDTLTDQWTAGSPFRAHLKDDTKDIFDAREEAKILAGTVMKSFENHGNVIATNRPSEIVADPKRMVASPRITVPPIDLALEFRIERKYFPTPAECEGFGDVGGFRLLQIDAAPGGTTKILHDDQSIPPSRHCPLDYDLADIITYYPEKGHLAVAILILMRKVGFEGPDGRYLAVTTRME